MLFINNKLPIDKCLVEYVFGEGLVDLIDQRTFDGSKILGAGVVGVARERLLEVLRLVELVGERHADGDGEPVHGGGLIALDGHGSDAVAGDRTFEGIVAIAFYIYNGQRSLSLYSVFQRVSELLTEGGVDERGVVAEGLDVNRLGACVDAAAGERHRHAAASEEDTAGEQKH